MTRDVLHPHPHLARLILGVGAAVHFFACLPLYGRRGFPEVDPFWLAMIWLWIPAVFLSAAFDRCPGQWEGENRRSRRRCRDLVFYALVTGFAVSWGTIMMVPSYKTALGALVGLVFYGPVMIAGVIIAEGLSQCVWAPIRRFLPRMRCEKCGYSARGLTEPRCPECGTHLSRGLLSQDPLTPTRSRTTFIVIAIGVICTAMFPFGYQGVTFGIQAASGRHHADQAWANGDYSLFEDTDPFEYLDDSDVYIEYFIDAETGFRREFYIGARSPAFFPAHNERMFELLAEHGLPAGSMKNHIVDGDHLAAMMDAPGFMEVTEYPHDFSPRLFLERGSFARWGTRTSAPRSSLTIGAVTSWHSHQLDDSRRCAWRFSEHDPEVVFIRVGDDWLGAYHVETGTHLATASR